MCKWYVTTIAMSISELTLNAQINEVITAACNGAAPNPNIISRYADAPSIASLDKLDGPSRVIKRGIVYLAGPMTGHVNFNYDTFHAVAYALRMRGVTVISPAETTAGVYAPAPAVEEVNREVNAEYLRRGFAHVLRSDAVLLLPGWQRSRGTRHELDVANMTGRIEVYQLSDEVLDAARETFKRR